MKDFRFASPWFLTLVVALAPVFYWMWFEKGLARLRFSSLSLLGEQSASSMTRRKWLPILRCVGLALLVLALARPQTGKALTESTTEAVDIMLVIDTSGSMRALDLSRGKERLTRLDVVKQVVADFVKKRAGDRIGMVVFGGEAYTQCPLTLDHGVVLSYLDQLEIGMAGDATAIGSALGIGTKRLKDLKSKSKIMVLLTDGRNNTGVLSPEKGAELAKTFGIKVYTIGVGTTEGKAPFIVEGFFGKQVVYQDVDLDEDTLKKIAATTGGRYYRAGNAEALANIYAEIDRLEKTEVKVKEYLEYSEHFVPFVWAGLLCLLVELTLAQTVLRRVP